jgi:NADH-quinone oxidoreductase subunit J
MLLGVDRTEDVNIEPITVQRPLALIVSTGVIGIVIAAVVTSREVLGRDVGGLDQTTLSRPDANIRQLAREIFGNNVFAFELTSVLLLVAVIGTVLMARRVKSTGAGK